MSDNRVLLSLIDALEQARPKPGMYDGESEYMIRSAIESFANDLIWAIQSKLKDDADA